MPKIGDHVYVDFTVYGDFVFSTQQGVILAVRSTEVDITAPFMGGAVPFVCPISALEAIGPGYWRTKFLVKT